MSCTIVGLVAECSIQGKSVGMKTVRQTELHKSLQCHPTLLIKAILGNCELPYLQMFSAL
jgi:hypothetical protein